MPLSTIFQLYRGDETVKNRESKDDPFAKDCIKIG